jgi:outer membrane receptor protein involved in Fe transport
VKIRSAALLLILVAMFRLVMPAQEATRSVSGVVVDSSGATIAGAEVRIQSASTTLLRTTDGEGRFSAQIPGNNANMRVIVRRAGFQRFERSLPAQSDLRLVLRVAPAVSVVNVDAHSSAASRGAQLPLFDTPESVSIASNALLMVQPAEALDEKLRLLPGFATFRRANSRAANPTTQGVSLRGIGSSGASRALVLSEGMPLNDPFGGWVYWDRVAEAAVESVEVLRGGASHLYGSGAMGGVIQMRESEARTGVVLNTSFASRATGFASTALSHDFGKLELRVSGEGYGTDGYFLPADDKRGAADAPASLRYGNGRVRIGYAASKSVRLYAGSSFLSETRNNGTQLQRNDTRLFDVTGGAEIDNLANGTVEVRAYGSGQRYNQTFSAVSADRNAETLTRIDGVPSQQVGGSALWRGTVGRHNVVFGFDGRHVRGDATGLVLATGVRSVVGGQQRSTGFFAQDRIQMGARAVLSAGGRVDNWKNFRGYSQVLAPQPGDRTTLAEHSQSAFSPHVALLYRLRDDLSLSVSAYSSFRAPTLQELYRGFRVGNVVTRANAELEAERLSGVEVGLSKRWDWATLRISGFWNRVSDPVANVTLDVTPELITRQRKNLGATRAAGFEAESTTQLTRWLSMRAAYQFADSVVTSFPADLQLEGKRVPQVPRHTGSFAAIFGSRGWTASMQLRAGGVQFDDDLNALPLPEYAGVDLFLGRELRRGVEMYVQAENLSGSRFEVARTPLTTYGPPASVSGGIRLSLFR